MANRGPITGLWARLDLEKVILDLAESKGNTHDCLPHVMLHTPQYSIKGDHDSPDKGRRVF